MKLHTQRKSGFTLVELSIVLVIIGLLIGGILVGQSIISSAQIQSIVRQVGQFDAAIASFKVKFNSYPGDTNKLSPAGDNDRRLSNTLTKSGAQLSTEGAFNGEIAGFWLHLSQTGFMPDKVIYSNDATTGLVAGVNVPSTAYGNGTTGNRAGVIPHGHRPNGAYPNSPWYILADLGLTTNSDHNTAGKLAWAYTPSEALALDNKMDDGIPRQPTMTSYDGRIWQLGSTVGACYNGTTYKYNITDTNKRCGPVISMAPDLGDDFR